MDKYIVKLTQEERAELLTLIRVGKKAANKLMHARVLLSADENDTKLKPKTDEEIATEMHVSSKTVDRIRQRFMEDVLDIYKRPYDSKRPVVCMDETSKQLIKETRCPIPAGPGESLRYDAEYERNGTCNIFLSCEPLKGKRTTKVTDQRKKIDWAHFIKELVDHDYSSADTIVLVMDNLNTHAGSSLYEAFEPAEAKRILDKLEIHYTPKHGSWLNMAEIELSHLSRQCLDRRIPDKETFIREISEWNMQRNAEEAIIDWQFTTEDARIKLKKLYPVLNAEGQIQ